jgi:hypothetical protein
MRSTAASEIRCIALLSLANVATATAKRMNDTAVGGDIETGWVVSGIISKA